MLSAPEGGLSMTRVALYARVSTKEQLSAFRPNFSE